MATSVSSATKHFPRPQEGFTTTTSGSVSSGATSVGLSSTGNYSNGDVVVLIIEPGVSGKEQSFTGTIDTSGSQVTGVVWASGTNSAHSGGVTVVDYVAAAHIQLISKGMLVEHNQDGTHSDITATSANISGTLKVDTVAERTTDTGVTIDGLSIKDGTLQTANSVTAANIDGIDKSLLTTDSNPYKFSVYRNAAWNTPNAAEAKVAFDTETFDTNSNFDSTTNNRYTAPVAGFYYFNAQIGFSTSVNNAYTLLYKNGAQVKKGSQTVATNLGGAQVSAFLQLAANDYVEVYVFTSATQTGSTGANNTYFDGFLVSRT